MNTDPIVIVGIDNIAYALNVGRRQVQAWIADRETRFPAVKVGQTGRYMAAAENLRDWARQFLKPSGNLPH